MTTTEPPTVTTWVAWHRSTRTGGRWQEYCRCPSEHEAWEKLLDLNVSVRSDKMVLPLGQPPISRVDRVANQFRQFSRALDQRARRAERERRIARQESEDAPDSWAETWVGWARLAPGEPWRPYLTAPSREEAERHLERLPVFSGMLNKTVRRENDNPNKG